MIFYIIRRLIAAVPTLLAVLTLVFLIVRVVPGDPAIAILGDRATPEGIAALDAKLGLDKPIWRQYVDFIAQSLSGDFGHSMVRRFDVDWAALGFSDADIDELAEHLLRIIQSFVTDPGRPPRRGEELREYLRRWVGAAIPPSAEASASARTRIQGRR